MDLATARKAQAEKDHEATRREALGVIEASYERILGALGTLGYPTATDDNFAETAARAAKATLEMVRPVAEIQDEIDEMLARTFPARYDEMVISKHNTCFGMCPHHLLPVIYRVSVAYLPGPRVLGISKLSRLTHLLARRPVLQEDLTHELAEILHTRLETRGSAAYIEGLHLCMAARGIEAHEARVVTSAVRGVFRDQPATRQEFLDLVTAPQPSLL
jgi:GTP cyclohydrolase I